eukprot:9880109-Lingulodinium_polyedra.AAC.1
MSTDLLMLVELLLDSWSCRTKTRSQKRGSAPAGLVMSIAPASPNPRASNSCSERTSAKVKGCTS